jgi:archaemetzincin
VRRRTLVAAAAFLAFDAACAAWIVGSRDDVLPAAAAAPVARARVAPPPATASVVDERTVGFERLGPPAGGDWRAAHPDETNMTFDEYVASGPVRADDEARTIAFAPVGAFSDVQRATLTAAAEFTGIWFDLPVRVLASEPLTDDDEQFRVRDDPAGRSGRQYRTRWFLNTLLPDLRPVDGVVLLGVTMADIYPGASWNYVFGEADLRRRVGVYSLVRYFPEFWGLERTPCTDRLALLRTLKIVVHETGHTFGLEHCAEWACAMNGCNSLGETDRHPLALCPTCLRKLAWNRGFDVRARYARIADFLAAHGLADEAAWNRARAAARR